MTERIFFFHNPKAGGSSVTTVLMGRTDPHQSCPLIENDKVQHETLAGDYKRFCGFSVYAGHYGRDIYNAVSAGHLPITNFRHPGSRLISLYNYFRHNVQLSEEMLREDRFFAVFCAKTVGFAEFISSDDPRLAVYTQNAHFRQLTNSCWSMDITNRLEDAYRFIDSMPWYYVCEYPQLSLFWARRAFSWDMNRMPIENVTRDQGSDVLSLSSLNEESYRSLYTKNRFDFDLYQYAVARLLLRTSIGSSD
jgi:hypothetical protein